MEKDGEARGAERERGGGRQREGGEGTGRGGRETPAKLDPHRRTKGSVGFSHMHMQNNEDE